MKLVAGIQAAKERCMFWLAYLFTVIVGGTFAVILRVLRKVLRSWG